MTAQRRLYVVGDVHGQLPKVLRHLREGGIVDERSDWSGEQASLWFLGDYFDRGPEGIEAIDLIMHLQAVAPTVGGHVGALLGNHDILLLAARRFLSDSRRGGQFIDTWLENGGQVEDLQRLNQDRSSWLQSLPSLALAPPFLLAHADSDFYLRYGRRVNTVNQAIWAVLQGDDEKAWERLIDDFSDRHVFDQTRSGGQSRVCAFLQKMGGEVLIHGHTPIDKVTGQDVAWVRSPYLYAGGRCVNVDGGMYRGGAGFVYETETLSTA